MITLQQTAGYAGDLATAPLSAVTLAFDFPAYTFPDRSDGYAGAMTSSGVQSCL